MWGCLSLPPYWDLARNPGMCPDWELNQGPFASQFGAQSTEPHQSGLLCSLNTLKVLFHIFLADFIAVNKLIAKLMCYSFTDITVFSLQLFKTLSGVLVNVQ